MVSSDSGVGCAALMRELGCSPNFSSIMKPVLIAAALAVLLTACSSLPTKAIISKENVEKAYSADAPIAEESERLPEPGEPWFNIRKGHSGILLVAGHATHPKREGELRFPDGGTGGFAITLAELTDSTVIYTTRASPSDPNYYDDNEFKAAIDALLRENRLKLVLDIHGSHWFRPYDVDFGTMGLKSLQCHRGYLSALVKAFREEGLNNFSLDYFPASKNQTVTKFVSQRGVPCIQLEINSNYMPVQGDTNSARPQRVARALQALTRYIRRYGNTYK